jgi:CBS domain-containing protein
MQTAADILQSKGSKVWSVKPGAKVLEALRVMAEHDVGAVLVCEGSKLVGIFSERDYARKVVLSGRSSRDSAIRDVMTTGVICVAPDRCINECMAVMTEKRLRHLPVVDEKGSIVGVISIGDLVKATIEAQEFTITQLQKYVTG